MIDDDALVLDGMRGILQSWGCQVETAASGDAALACLGQNGGAPDLIISDYTLSGVTTGTDIVAALHASLASPVPIVILTGDIRTATSNAITRSP